MSILSEAQWDILTYIEEHWMNKGAFPSISTIANKTGRHHEEIVDAISDPVMKTALDRRGITFLETDRLTPEQLATIQLLLNVSDKRSMAAKLKALGVSQQKYAYWKKQPHFMKEMRTVGEKLFGETQTEVNAALVNSALSGDIKAITYYNKLSGRYNERVESQVDLQRVMVTMLEVIQKEVKDPNVLRAIGNGFEAAMIKEQAIQGALER